MYWMDRILLPRSFVYVRDADDLITEAQKVVKGILNRVEGPITKWAALKNSISRKA